NDESLTNNRIGSIPLERG
ncbi:hypothetical protein GWI33_021972, partial [Rhynchophorus ferrugineus]